MPWIFRFPPNRIKDLSNEPKTQKIKMSFLTKAIFYLPKREFENQLDYIEENSDIKFKKDKKHMLTLEFNYSSEGMIKEFKELDLTIKY